MSEVKSKNLYELLGNDEGQESDKEPAPPTKVAEQPSHRKGKRDTPADRPVERVPGKERQRGARRDDFQGSERAFQDRGTGSTNNRGKPVDDSIREDRHSNQVRGGRFQGGEARGGRGGRSGRGGRGGRDDRHTRGFQNDHPKQAEQAWGATTGDSEWRDEKAGEAIAKADEKEEGAAGGWDATTTGDNGGWDAPATGWDPTAIPPPLDSDGTAPPNGEANIDPTAAKAAEGQEEEDKSRSYADYLAEQAEKKLQLGAPSLKARKPNEGTKVKKEWENAKALSKEDKEGTDAFMQLGKDKAKREREKKQKNVLDVDLRHVEPNTGRSERGGRGGRGRSDRGGPRGDRGGRGTGGAEFRARGGGRGRGGYESGGGKVDVEDKSAFPSLSGS